MKFRGFPFVLTGSADLIWCWQFMNAGLNGPLGYEIEPYPAGGFDLPGAIVLAGLGCLLIGLSLLVFDLTQWIRTRKT